MICGFWQLGSGWLIAANADPDTNNMTTSKLIAIIDFIITSYSKYSNSSDS
jgi:hypothetical protein